jgi:hypothetical protein
MLRAFAKSAMIGAIQRKVGVSPAGTIPTMLLTSGASMLLSRGRRPVGLALVALGGLLLWREIEHDRADVEAEEEISPALVPPVPAPDPAGAAAATGSR